MTIKRLTYFFIWLACFSLAWAGLPLWAQSGEDAANKSEAKDFLYYTDIPGVTQADIKAVEELKAKRKLFVYGAPFSTEAFLAHDGKIHGFSSLFCEYLSNLFGIEVQPKLMNWDELIKGMVEDTVDLVGELSITPDRQKFLFMTPPIAERSIKYMRLEGTEPLFELAKKSSTPLRYGFMFDSSTVGLLRDNAPEAFLVTEVQSEDEAYKLLKEGTIDAYVTESTAEAAFDKYPDVETFDYIPILYSDVSLSSKNKDLVPIINVFSKALDAGIQERLVELYNQGFAEYRHHKFLLKLTPEELNYLNEKIAANESIVYAAEHDNYPLSFYNDIEGQFQGVSMDVIEDISKLTGLKFKLWNDKPVGWIQTMAALERGEFEMVTELIMIDDRQGKFIWSTVGYSSDKYALISKTETPDKEINEILYSKVGIVEGTGWADAFFKWFRNHKNTVTYASSKDAFMGLTKGEIELFMGTRNLNLSMTSFMEQPGFKVNLTFNYTFDSLFGFNKNQTLLCSIISKSIPLTDADVITERWLQKTFDYRGKLARSRVPVLFGFSIMLFVSLALSFLLIKKYIGDKDRLARIVSQRTAELMIQTDEATRASRAKGDFLARMSHEIRTPMNAIIGMAELALRENPPDETAEMISSIQSAGASLLSIINDILDFSKIESGKMELANSDYHLGSLIHDVVSVISARIMGTRLELLVELDANLPSTLYGDEVRFRQVLFNLLSNGVKYTKEGFVTLRLEALPPDQGERFQGASGGAPNSLGPANFDADPLQSSAHFRELLRAAGNRPTEITLKASITDTGIGIKAEDMEKLFTSFSQVDSERNKGIEGTGLGLAISKNLAKLMGGDIAVQSEYQKGSVFTATVKQIMGAPYVPFSTLKKPEKSKSLLLESDHAEAKAFAFAMNSLGAKHSRVQFLSDLKTALRDGDFDFLFAPFEASDEVLEVLKEMGSAVKPVFTLDVGASIGKKKYLRLVHKPLYCLPIANILNDADKLKGAKDRHDRVGFIAPTATVLVVDDIKINLKVVIGLLKPFKVRVDTTESGEEAIELVKNKSYDLIYMDHMMPGMDGLEATARIRELPQGKDIPIIALTANAITGVKEMFISHGMNDFISKPIEYGKLEASLSDWLPKEKLQFLNPEQPSPDLPTDLPPGPPQAGPAQIDPN
ncbi:MAG: transporter substrate-binding domain-containing protein [Deltaproteobacteria bacterium]|jgi:signal transduction histidine kinase/ActR/RegA family two-component response regulator|nr:transporter substrate-binding domain-containing protein [Deltaproteobacteria bacterium]